MGQGFRHSIERCILLVCTLVGCSMWKLSEGVSCKVTLLNMRLRKQYIEHLSWPTVTELSHLTLPTFHTGLSDLANRHGPVFGMPLGDMNAIIVGDAALAEHVL